MALYALLSRGVVTAIIVADDEEFPASYVDRDDTDCDRWLPVDDTTDPAPSVGWVVRGDRLIPGQVIAAVDATVPAGGATTVTFTCLRPHVSVVPVTVNGTTRDALHLTDGAGEVQVDAGDADDTGRIVVQIGDVAAVITVAG